jgi:hypothetical protein
MIDLRDDLIVEGCFVAFLLPFGLSFTPEEVVISGKGYPKRIEEILIVYT